MDSISCSGTVLKKNLHVLFNRDQTVHGEGELGPTHMDCEPLSWVKGTAAAHGHTPTGGG